VKARLSNIDIAHLHACRNLPVAMAARALAAAGVPYVVSPNGTAPLLERRFLAKRVFDATVGRGYLERATRVLAVSEAERLQIAGLGVAPSRIDCLPNPVDEREFDPAPDGARFRHAHGLGDAPLVLLLGKLTPRKGAAALLQAFSQLESPDVRLLIAGSDMDSGLGRHVTASDPRVRRLGVLKGKDRLDALAAANVVAYPSRDEVFGLVPIEALLAGSPVIVCCDSGAGEIIGAIGGGQIIPPGDPESLRGAMVSMLEANGLWRQRARIAAIHARQRFGADNVCERLEAIYRDVLDRQVEGRRRSA
jgi:glycosyltransferase involved in cell wall biosynthesis